MNERAPVRTVADLDALPSGEVVEGYLDGFHGEEEPGGNRSRAYWHGWRNGRVDGGFAKGDDAQAALAHEIVETGYLRSQSEPQPPTRKGGSVTQRAAFRQSDVSRLVRGALKGGLPVGSFKIAVENGQPVLLPIAANAPLDDAADVERRMKDAFGEP